MPYCGYRTCGRARPAPYRRLNERTVGGLCAQCDCQKPPIPPTSRFAYAHATDPPADSGPYHRIVILSTCLWSPRLVSTECFGDNRAVMPSRCSDRTPAMAGRDFHFPPLMADVRPLDNRHSIPSLFPLSRLLMHPTPALGHWVVNFYYQLRCGNAVALARLAKSSVTTDLSRGLLLVHISVIACACAWSLPALLTAARCKVLGRASGPIT